MMGAKNRYLPRETLSSAKREEGRSELKWLFSSLGIPNHGLDMKEQDKISKLSAL